MDKIKSVLFGTKPIISIDLMLLFYRIAVSLAMIKIHGIKKLMDWEGTVQNIPDPFGMGGEISALVAIFANIIGPLMVILGLFTRLAIFPIVMVTTIGFLIVHSNDPWTVRDIPLMYSFAYLILLVLGPGKYSLDAYLFKTDK